MSVVGFDVGNDTSCVALARKRGIDVLLNNESKRETPAVVNFGEKMRFVGTAGSAKFSLAPQNTVHQLKRIIGKKFSDPALQADIQKFPFSVTEAPDGGCLVHVMYCNERHSFSPEQLMAMILVDLKKNAEKEAGIVVTDCAISVPTYFTESERYAMLNAASIAGLNCLRLINENTATALAYGIYKTDLPETDPVHVAFVDVGHSSTQVSIVALRKNGLQIKAHAWDRNLGGRDFDEVLFDHFCAEFKEKNKIDIRSNKKASFKLRQAVEKLKKTLSANPEAPINIECIMEDTDVRSHLNRDTFEVLAEPILSRIQAPIQQAVKDAGISLDDISSVEIVGSTTRIPAVFKLIEEAFKRTPSRTMNSKECVSRGAALQCAMLSPVFKVREFEVIDACPYTVEFRWDKDGEVAAQRLFERNAPFPSAKMLTFLRNQPFSISAHVLETGQAIGEYQIGPFDVPPGSDKAKLKVKVRMNLHGLVSVESVESVQEVEEAPKDVKMEDAAAAPAAAAQEANGAQENGGDAAAPMETDAAGAKPVDAGADAKAAEKKKKVKKHDVAFKADKVLGLNKKALDDYFEKEGQMQAADHLQEETNEAKNALEGYVYSLRNRLYDSLGAYVKEADKEKLMNALQAMEDWLYDEGEDTSKSVYIGKLEELRKQGGPVEAREREDQTRGPAADALKHLADYYLAFTRSEAPQYAHIDAAERATVAKEAEAALKWLSEKQSLQAQLAKWDEPALLTADINKKKATLDTVCKPITTKPAPKPAAPPPQPAPAPAAGAEGAGAGEEAAPMEAESPDAVGPEPPAEGQPMEQ
mmetsp:Transcript_37740/g.84112  ORF Transcript_37740/g.84112 Transcript_37740/m.84112 type:complete len:814 (+) Transcript_37740:104-2545(+)|eukprot:CAMPEP_0202922454 /NCGR_PEP_ID=MMETSP1392-20130828/77929_1 /ASSEMBLY_ACC=CAM_ASM_000868 /TAXON_ID=225041 /ORGANISM="Chlamydomonas chlamydogama, Strain SAG 11-48b" /LENGTH=813 /DNA_ID=CAMNT_0049616081 /DNA_START=76 /DNA_END=2517 /DNA_ORIENTATION=-